MAAARGPVQPLAAAYPFDDAPGAATGGTGPPVRQLAAARAVGADVFASAGSAWRCFVAGILFRRGSCAHGILAVENVDLQMILGAARRRWRAAGQASRASLFCDSMET